jgi:predicted ATPase
MKRYIITGTPGSGKTALIRAIEMQGDFVVEEAATDVIEHEQNMGKSEPWQQPKFLDRIINLQKQRQIQAKLATSAIQFYDRSPICTYALAIYLGFEVSAKILEEVHRSYEVYEKQVFFIENLGFCKPTNARKISYKEALVFEQIHRAAYAKFGYHCIKIEPAPISKRVANIFNFIQP